MADGDFDPDAYLKEKAFDPDAYLRPATPLPRPRPAEAPLPHPGRAAARAMREGLRTENLMMPAGQDMASPDLSGERGTAGEIASEWGDIGKGIVKGVPAATGIPGDIEAGARGFINAFAPPKKPFVSPTPYLPPTSEGGMFGPRMVGAKTYGHLVDPAANPREAFGMQIPGMVLQSPAALEGAANVVSRAARPIPRPPELPPAQPGPVATVREGSGARLLPADLPHDPLPATGTNAVGAAGVPGTSTVGAASAGPLADISPDTLAYWRRRLQVEEPTTKWALESDIEKMSPHQTLAEFSANTEKMVEGLATKPGASRSELVNTYKQRDLERPERVRAMVDDAVGEKENLAALRRAREVEAGKKYNPLYKQFREERIPPPITPELQAALYTPVSGLMDRLHAADAFSLAQKKAALEGVAWDKAFGGYGPIPEGRWPTNQSWDYIKRALDKRIQDSLTPLGKATDDTRLYQSIKTDLMNIVDNDVWRRARKEFSTPRQITEAEDLGRKFFKIDQDELPYLLADFSDAEKAGYLRGVRKELHNKLGGAGAADMKTVREVLSPNVVEKLEGLLGPEKAARLVAGFQYEANMAAAHSRIIHGSPTAGRVEAGAQWDAHALAPGGLTGTANIVGHGAEAIGSPLKKGREIVGSIADKMMQKRAQRIWDESARLATLQGPERDAVLRYLLTPEEVPAVIGHQATGGRVIRRASGGRVVHFDPKTIGARKNPRDGNYYLPGKKPGTWFKVVPRNG